MIAYLLKIILSVWTFFVGTAPAPAAAVVQSPPAIMFDAGVSLAIPLGIPFAEFQRQFPKAKCARDGALAYCKFENLPKQICTMATCLGGTVLFTKDRSCGLIAEAAPTDWVFLRQMLLSVRHVPEEVQEMPEQTAYVSHWTSKRGDLFFTQQVNNARQHPPDYSIGFMGNPPYDCHKP